MLICKRCGELRNESALTTYEEIHGSTCMGQLLAEKRYDYECDCGGTFTSANQCPICHSWYDKEQGTICEDCLEEGETVENAIAVGEEDYATVRVNGFAAAFLGKERINQILVEAVKRECKEGDISIALFCEKDKLWFMQWLEEGAV